MRKLHDALISSGGGGWGGGEDDPVNNVFHSNPNDEQVTLSVYYRPFAELDV